MAALESELATMGVTLEDSALAASAMALARAIDDEENSATSRSLCAGRLAEALDRLRELNPPQEGATPLDEIQARRDRRLARAKDSVAPATGG